MEHCLLYTSEIKTFIPVDEYLMSERAPLGRENCCVEGKSFVLEQLGRHFLSEEVIQQICSVLSFPLKLGPRWEAGDRPEWCAGRKVYVSACIPVCPGDLSVQFEPDIPGSGDILKWMLKAWIYILSVFSVIHCLL